MPIALVKPTELLALIKRVEARGAIETTHHVQQNCSRVFRYAVATGRADSDPSRDLRGALTPWKPEHYPTLSDPRQVGRLLRDIDVAASNAEAPDSRIWGVLREAGFPSATLRRH